MLNLFPGLTLQLRLLAGSGLVPAFYKADQTFAPFLFNQLN
jgi:hypothetical protein